MFAFQFCSRQIYKEFKNQEKKLSKKSLFLQIDKDSSPKSNLFRTLSIQFSIVSVRVVPFLLHTPHARFFSPRSAENGLNGFFRLKPHPSFWGASITLKIHSIRCIVREDKFAYTFPCCTKYSAIWTALRAAPFLIWSPLSQKVSPFSLARSLRTRPT